MTPKEFRTTHGDTTTWTTADYEAYEHLIETQPEPTPDDPTTPAA